MGNEEREEREENATDREEVAEEVAEEATPETDTEAVEQRTDDYDGIVRRLDDLFELVNSKFDAINGALEALGVAAVEGDVSTAATGEATENVIDELLGIDALDLL